MIAELLAAVDRIAAMPSPEAQARALGEMMAALSQARRATALLRGEVVRRLRATHSHQEIADLLGVHRGTAQQIAEGKQTGRRKRPPEPPSATPPG